MTAAGTLVLMGSGETTPTMVTIHKGLLAATAERRGEVRTALLDTPYGFQENAGEITAKALQYFAHNVGQPVTHVTARRVEGADGMAVERALDAIRRSDWVFAGPGSPTYAIRQWGAAPFAEAFAEVVDRDGTVVLASAAAVTAGERTIPVYEVYKAGEAPAWRPGLGLVARLTGWSCVVIPHYDNSEGGTHDTRFCYMGETRLRSLEADLPEEGWVLGVDEHTAAVLDRGARVLRVEGRGGVHLRRDGVHLRTVPAGEAIALDEVEAVVEGRSGAIIPPVAAEVDTAVGSEAPAEEAQGLDDQVAALKARFDAALDARDAEAATAAALEVEQLVRAWAADTLTGGELERAITTLRGMITRLGDLAGAGMHDHTELVRPVIETLLHVREDARARKAFEVADHIRGHMDADGIRVEDTREGTRWEWDEPAI